MKTEFTVVHDQFGLNKTLKKINVKKEYEVSAKSSKLSKHIKIATKYCFERITNFQEELDYLLTNLSLAV